MNLLNWQEKQRKFQRSNVKNNELHVHWDFINDPNIHHSIESRGMWGSLQEFAFLAANVVYGNEDGKLTETTKCYFNEDSKHDWTTRLVRVKINNSKAPEIL